MKKIRLLLLLPTVLLSTSCEPFKKRNDDQNFSVDKSLIFGMDDIYWQEKQWSHISFTQEHKLFKALGVKSIRFWAHATWMLSDPTTVDQKQYQVARDSLDQIKDEGYQIIGMNHGSFKRNYTEQYATTATAKPPRDLTPGSRYLKWLEDYEQSWYTLVQLFPEITYWEIDNETNNVDFMTKVGGGQFSQDEMAQITYDMMYFGSKGIHRGNPNAITVMGGLVVKSAATFIDKLYDLIYNVDNKGHWDSNNPDDYFQCAAWHPYMSGFSKRGFISINNEIYDVVKKREGKDKKVFLTEAGINDTNYSNDEAKCARFVKEMYEAARDDLYYVEAMHYYRMWDLDGARYGLFADPTKAREASANETNLRRGAAKAAAYAYQEIAGGSGDLNTFADYIELNGTCDDVTK